MGAPGLAVARWQQVKLEQDLLDAEPDLQILVVPCGQLAEDGRIQHVADNVQAVLRVCGQWEGITRLHVWNDLPGTDNHNQDVIVTGPRFLSPRVFILKRILAPAHLAYYLCKMRHLASPEKR
jgi:hypothetical protein